MAKALKYPAATISIERSGKAAMRPEGKKHQKLEIDAALDPELYGTALLAAGEAQAAAGSFSQAAASFQMALDFHIQLYGETHALIVDCRLHLAEALRRIADLKGARAAIEAAEQLARTGKGISTIQLGLVLNELAALELHFNNLKAALPAALESQRLLEEAGDPRRTLPMDTLARIHCARGQFEAARGIYLEMQAIDSATFLGTNHPRYIAHLHNLATVLQSLGEAAYAVKAFKKVAESIEKLYGESYPDLPTVYANLGRLEQNRKKFAAAEEHFERARKLTKKLLGEKHPFYGYDLANLGRLALDREDAKQAEKYLSEAVAIYLKAYDRPHVYLASALTFLAYAQLDLHKPEAARKSADEAVALWEQIAELCADRAGDAGACDRAFAKVVADAAQAACSNPTKDGAENSIVCAHWDTLDGKLQKGDIRRRLLTLLVARGCIKPEGLSDCVGSEGPQQMAAASTESH
jgi:tetratricopeptide (TPR) repeat protein